MAHPTAPRPATVARVTPTRTAASRAVASHATAAGAGQPLTQVPRATFRAHIADRLRAAILCGDLAPGAALVETALAAQFNVSRAPLREALRQLIEEGLVLTVPYTGTRVIGLSVDDLREIQSMRITLERFAFEQAWPRRDATFRRALRQRHDALTQAIDRGDELASIDAELALHGLVYETSGHQLLQRTWASLRGRLQLYWAAHHRAHGASGPRRDSHDSYVRAALGDDLPAMCAEIDQHMQRGAEQTEQLLRAPAPVRSRARAPAPVAQRTKRTERATPSTPRKPKTGAHP